MKLKHVVLFLPMLFFLLSVLFSKPNQCKLFGKSFYDTTTNPFIYKEILEDYVDTILPNQIKTLYGNWKIVAIAKVGGDFESEEQIRKQIGRKLYLDSAKCDFDFFDKRKLIVNPYYKLIFNNSEFTTNLKTATFFYGYRPCRKNIIMLNISNVFFFEIITFKEIAYYNDGRIYFLTRD